MPLSFHPSHPRRTVNAMRLLLAAPEDVRPALTHALYRAYWVDNDDLSEPRTLATIAREHGIDPDVVKDPAIKQVLFDAVDEAVARGAFGVPTLFVGDDMWWGVDRLPLVREALGAPRPLAPERVKTGASLVMFHDFSSPFSYLASTQVERIARETGANLTFAPFLLGALFKEIGTPLVPMDAMNPAKRAYYESDLKHMAGWWGVPFRWSSHFPLRTVAALRVAIQEPATTTAIYRAAWAEDRDIADAVVLRGVLDDAGFDGAALLEGTQDRDVKDTLRANTAWARRAGACGAPTFLVDGEVLFWGEDRLDMVADALRGWRPAVG